MNYIGGPISALRALRIRIDYLGLASSTCHLPFGPLPHLTWPITLHLAECHQNTRTSRIGPRKALNSDVDVTRLGPICERTRLLLARSCPARGAGGDVMAWIICHLVCCPYCNGNALRVRRGSFVIWSNLKTLKP